ncbi:MAG TPA: AI-2E family transporter [Lacipirellulaceae bacterium]|nr:AI-2E family transporter [Lacipirellulaceae bacterium]HMP05827.1 AI-2E family transporter [Lacipirellulaceae bacterium]
MTTSRRASSGLFTLAAIVTSVAALYVAREILLPFALAVLLSFLLAPLADRLEARGVWRVPAVVTVVSIAVTCLGLLGWIVTSQLIELSGNMEKYRANIVAKVREISNQSSIFSGVTKTIEQIREEVVGPDAAGDEIAADNIPSGDAEQPLPSRGRSARPTASRLGEFQQTELPPVRVVALPPSPLSQVQAWLGPLVAPLTAAGMVVVLVLFMLLQREDQRNRLIRLFGVANIHATTEALTDVVERVSQYLRMQFLINAGYGLSAGLGLSIIGVPSAIMFGVLCFALRFLPYIGPWIAAAMPLAVSAAVSEGWTQPLIVIGMFIVLELIVNNVAEPLLYGSSIGVSGIGVIVAAIFWTWIWGPVGLVMAMPLTVCLVVMARYIPALRFVAILLGDQPSLTTEERIYQRMLAFDEEEVQELAAAHLADHNPTEFYDDVLLPALRLAERDRHAGFLTEEQEDAVQEAARDLISQLPTDGRYEDYREPGTRALCIPLRDEADKTAALMLQKLLGIHGVELRASAVGALTSELVESVESMEVDLVIVSVLPPLASRDSRLLCRKLRSRYPTLPIIVGYWDAQASPESRRLLSAKADGEIVTSLAEAVERSRAIASRKTKAVPAPHFREASTPTSVKVE